MDILCITQEVYADVYCHAILDTIRLQCPLVIAQLTHQLLVAVKQL